MYTIILKDDMKPIFTVINHYRPELDDEQLAPRGHGRSPKKGRAEGRLLLKDFIDSLEDSLKIKHDVLIVDNASFSILTEVDVALNYNYISLDDDDFGLTRAWNIAANFGYMNGNDYILVCNDDITFNESINNLFETIEQSDMPAEDTLWGILTDCTSQSGYHFSKDIGNGFIDVTNEIGPVDGGLHGWFYCFHRSYFKKYAIDGKLFDETWQWSGGERFQHAHRAKGGRQCIALSTLVQHGALGSWRHNRKNCIKN